MCIISNIQPVEASVGLWCVVQEDGLDFDRHVDIGVYRCRQWRIPQRIGIQKVPIGIGLGCRGRGRDVCEVVQVGI